MSWKRNGFVAIVSAALVAALLALSGAANATAAPPYTPTPIPRDPVPTAVEQGQMASGWSAAVVEWHLREAVAEELRAVAAQQEAERREAAARKAAEEKAAAEARWYANASRPAPTTTTTAPAAPTSSSTAYGAGAGHGPCGGWEGLISAHFPSEVARACRVMMCESGGNPNAKNSRSTASGLWQFLNSTWESVTGKPAPASAYSPAEQTAAAAKLRSAQGWSPWVCS